MTLQEKLTNEKAVALAAQLTQATLSSISFKFDGPYMRTQEELARYAADKAYLVFNYLLDKILVGQEPAEIHNLTWKQQSNSANATEKFQ